MQTLMQSEGMYNFALFLQFMAMILQPILYIAGIVALIFVIRALMVYVKNNKPTATIETVRPIEAEGSVFGNTSAEKMAEVEAEAETETEAPAEEGPKA